MAEVIVSRIVENKLRDLTEVLYDEEYFNFKEDAQAYVHKITLFNLCACTAPETYQIQQLWRLLL